LQRNIMT